MSEALDLLRRIVNSRGNERLSVIAEARALVDREDGKRLKPKSKPWQALANDPKQSRVES